MSLSIDIHINNPSEDDITKALSFRNAIEIHIYDPSEDEIIKALSLLNGDLESYLILQRSKMTYMQTGGLGYHIDYQEGSLDYHYFKEVASFDRLCDVFISYATGYAIGNDDDWKNDFTWERMEL